MALHMCHFYRRRTQTTNVSISTKASPTANIAIDQGNKFYIDNSKVLAYGLRKVTIAMVEEICEQVTKSYAKEISH